MLNHGDSVSAEFPDEELWSGLHPLHYTPANSGFNCKTTFKELEPVTTEINTAIKAGKDISGPTNTLMTKIIPLMIKHDSFINVMKAGGMVYGGYETSQSTEASNTYWSSIRSDDGLQLQIVRNVALVLSLVTAVISIANPVPPPAIDPIGVFSGVFDVISNYAWPI